MTNNPDKKILKLTTPEGRPAFVRANWIGFAEETDAGTRLHFPDAELLVVDRIEDILGMIEAAPDHEPTP